MASVVFLPGKPPKAGTVFDVVPRMLAENGISVRLALPHQSDGFDEKRWPEEALVVHRGLRREALVRLVELEQRGWRCCNRAHASLRVQDRGGLMGHLRSAGLPVPGARVLVDWADVRNLPRTEKVVVKAADGTIGRGARVLFSTAAELPEVAPFPGPYVVEDRVENDGVDRKLYLAGSACFGLLKPWPRSDAAPEPFAVGEELRELAAAAGAATELEIFGLDVLLGPEGPVVIDVNPFPSFNGVDGGPAAVARYLAELAAPEAANG